LQLLRLGLSAVEPTVRRAAATLGAWLYAGYWWLVLGVFAAVMWPLVILLPRLSWRWAAMHAAARLLLRLQGIRLSVDMEAEPPLNDAIIVINHSSYVDALVLTAALPGQPVYAAKREFESNLFVRPFLKRIGALFVERFEPKTGVEDTRRASALAREGKLLVFFPEATFTRLAGLAEFRLGAFLVAAETGRPIIPVVLRGTRSVLRGSEWFPRRGNVSVYVGRAFRAEGHDFAAAVRLRDEVRTMILARCGEPDLAPPGGFG
jgi:1-acyl-sn-glycerol-3-phosphate acyltransferase